MSSFLSCLKGQHSFDSLLAVLNTHLRGRTYFSSVGGRSSYTRCAVETETDQKDVLIETPNKIPRPKKRLLRDFLATGSLNVDEIADGFLNKKGDEVYIIEDVLEYCPTRGYLVKWVGWIEPTWNKPSYMPKTRWVASRMREAKSKSQPLCKKPRDTE